MRRVTTIEDVREAVSAARGDGSGIVLVPTMGALHEGHLSLVRLAAARGATVVVSVFVNPTQFGPDEDLDSYPRDLERDEAELRALGEATPDLVFAPDVEEMYPREPLTTVSVERLTDVLCGASRPGHFDGVTTVVAKLLHIVEPDVAIFGRKDYQQLTVIRRMVADLDLPVEIVGGPTVREPDGVAMSSRNDYLDAEQRVHARALSQALRRAVQAARESGAGRGPSAGMIRDLVLATLRAESDVRVDYVEVVDPDTLVPPPDADSDADGDAARGEEGEAAGTDPGSTRESRRLLVAVAAHVGPARLIDNVVIGDEEDEDRLLAATGG